MLNSTVCEILSMRSINWTSSISRARSRSTIGKPTQDSLGLPLVFLVSFFQIDKAELAKRRELLSDRQSQIGETSRKKEMTDVSDRQASLRRLRKAWLPCPGESSVLVRHQAEEGGGEKKLHQQPVGAIFFTAPLPK